MSICSTSLQLNNNNPITLPTSNVSPIDLKSTDIYSQETFEYLLKTRREEGLDFYVAVINERGLHHCFEASKFLEHFFEDNRRNPLTNLPFSSFEVYKFSEDNDCCTLYCDSKQAWTPPFYLPIFLNDPTQSDEDRMEDLHRMACVFLKEPTYDLDKAVYWLTQAAEKGLKKSQGVLSYTLLKNKQNKEGIVWLKKYLENSTSSSKDMFVLAVKIQKDNPAEALDWFEKAASLGNYFALASVIVFYEKDAVLQNPQKASLWRESLPQDWQNSKIIDFLDHLDKTNYDPNST